MKTKIAILGGSFDPVHNGHLSLAENTQIELEYDKIIFFPAAISPFKQGASPLDNMERLKLLEFALESNPDFLADDFELIKKGVSYTIETVKYCYEKYPIEGKLGLIIGQDLLTSFYQWHEAKTILSMVDLIVGQRPHKTVLDKAEDELSIKLTSSAPHSSPIPPYIQLQNETLEISSTYIRTAIKQNKAWRYLVPEKVYDYINKKGYYR